VNGQDEEKGYFETVASFDFLVCIRSLRDEWVWVIHDVGAGSGSIGYFGLVGNWLCPTIGAIHSLPYSVS
jgi:hypothetical protein